MEPSEFKVLGKTTRRKDGVARVTGQEQFPSDVILPRMLHGRVVSSPYAHARIKRIDVSAAEAMGAVCITWDDVPHVCYNERIVTVPSALQRDHYVLADKVRRMGEAVAAVAAETEELAERAARAVVVEYEPLPVLIDCLGWVAHGFCAPHFNRLFPWKWLEHGLLADGEVMIGIDEQTALVSRDDDQWEVRGRSAVTLIRDDRQPKRHAAGEIVTL